MKTFMSTRFEASSYIRTMMQQFSFSGWFVKLFLFALIGAGLWGGAATAQVNSFSPQSGSIGTQVVVQATYNMWIFTGPTTTSSRVEFSGPNGTYVTATMTSTQRVSGTSFNLTVTVPSGAVTGPIRVFYDVGANASGVSSSNFSVSSPSPSLTLNTTSLTSLGQFNTLQGTVSQTRTFDVSGTQLTGNVVVTAPAGMEVAPSTGPFSSTVTLTPTSGTLATTQVRLRVASSASPGQYSGSVTVASTGATTQSFSVLLNVTPAPLINIVLISPLTPLTTTAGTASAAQSFMVSATDLLGNVTISAPAGLELSTTQNGSFSTTLSLTSSTGTITNQLVWVRIAATANAGSLSGNINITSPFASTQSVSLPSGSNVIGVPSLNGNFSISAQPLTTVAGTPSTAQSFTVAGTDLTGNLIVTPPANIELAQNQQGPYNTTPISITPVNGTVAITTLWKRIAASAPVGPVSGNIVLSSTGATSQPVPIPSNSVVSAPPPAITGFSPTSGRMGSVVTITGTGFVPTLQGNSVRFNQIPATILSASTTQLVVAVPRDPSLMSNTASLVVTNTSNNQSSASFGTLFTVTGDEVLSLTPAAAAAGQSIVVRVSDANSFQQSTPPANTVLRFFVNQNNTVAGTITSRVYTGTPYTYDFTVTVPNTAATGPITVLPDPISFVTTSYASSLSFTLLTPPLITAITPVSAAIGSNITLVGAFFDPVAGNNTVLINGVPATVVSVLGTQQLVVTVPQGATSGTIQVTNTTTGLSTTSTTSLTVFPQPTLTSVSPAAAAVNTNITVTGTNLTGGTVTIGGVAATVVSNTGTTMVVTVPSSATAGPVVVTTSGGTASRPFTVNFPPVITSVSPASAPVGTNLTLTGTNFNTTASGNTVTIGGVAATVVSASTSQLVVTIPAGATSGTIQVTNTATALSGSNNSGFTLILPPSGLQYTLPTAGISTQAAVNMPPVVSGSAATYSINPALPQGMSINPNTGVITGQPTQAVPFTTYTITATNAGGTTTTTVSFGVGGTPRSLVYSPAVATFNVGVAGSLAAPALVSFPAATFSVQPALPQGMSINTQTGAISGVPAVPVVPARSYVVTAANNFGTTTATLTIGVNDAPPAGLVFAPAAISALPNTAITAVVPATAGGAVTQWSISPALPAGLSMNAQTGVISGALTATGMSGTVTYTITATNSGGSVSMPYTITYSIPTTISGFTAPQGSVVYGSAPITLAAPQSNNPAPFSYSSSNAGVALLVNGNQLRITGAGTTTITVSQAAQGAFLPASSSYVLTVQPAPLTIVATNTFRCVNTVNPQFGYTVNGYVNGENASVLTALPQLATTATPNSVAGTYPITASGAQAANYSINYVNGTLTVNNPVNRAVRLPIVDAIKGERTQLQARSFGVTYQWAPATGLTNTTTAMPSATLSNEVTYTIASREVTGCLITDTLQVRVFDAPEVYVPNMFSPNGDGINDVLRINPVGLKQLYYFRIYNRWHQLLYESRDLNGGWNGTYFSTLQPMETYQWILSAQDKDGKWIQRTGSVTLVR